MPENLDFEELERLRNFLASVRRNHVPTLNHYASEDGKGFWHQPTKREKASLSSTATCVSCLVRSGLWKYPSHRWGASKAVAQRLLGKPWESAGLKENNPFSLSFIAEGVLDLIDADKYEGWEANRETVVTEIAPLLLLEVESAASSTAPFAVPGSVSITPYPPSAYLTQLAFRVLKRCVDGERLQRAVPPVRAWARSEINRQVALITTRSKIADPLQLAYAIILAASASEDEHTSPEEKSLLRQSLAIFFASQQPDGGWPSSQPLFHYPDVGNAQCFDYELLTQLLACDSLKDELLQFLPELRLAGTQLTHLSFDLGTSAQGSAVGWASGHHPQIEGPESWSTASVYDFVHVFDRLVAEAIRRAVFRELRAVYSPPERGLKKAPESFAPDFLDATVTVNGDARSLRTTLLDYFVLPIEAEKAEIANGGRLKPTTPMSAILFGPPGTSKTKLAKIISSFLGWPLLSVDPSYLVQDGLDRLYSRANRLFAMLAMSEEIVVILDEFDEIGRDRSQSNELLSRFITTSMLPKLAAINDERKIVFILATNYISRFDVPFSRGGRFDMILQVMPPTMEAKLKNPKWSGTLKAALEGLSGRRKVDSEEALTDLTFLETQQLVFELGYGVEDVADAFKNAKKKWDFG
jgi:ATPase family associated with various cellular activities (AAA)